MTQFIHTKHDVTKHYDTTFIHKKPDVTKHYDPTFIHTKPGVTNIMTQYLSTENLM